MTAVLALPFSCIALAIVPNQQLVRLPSLSSSKAACDDYKGQTTNMGIAEDPANETESLHHQGPANVDKIAEHQIGGIDTSFFHKPLPVPFVPQREDNPAIASLPSAGT